MWEPIVTDPTERAVLHDKINQITASITQGLSALEDEGVISGASGISLYFAYLQKFNPRGDYTVPIEKLLERIIEKINSGYNNTTLGSGIAGIIWTIHHLRSNGFIEFDEDVSDILAWLSVSIEHSSGAAHFDYMHGAMGIAKATLKYPEYTPETYYHTLLRNLETHARQGADGLYWESYIFLDTEPILATNIGLAHGMSSVIVVLAEMHQRFPGNAQIKALLDASIRFVQNNRYTEEESLASFYPGFIHEGKKQMGDRIAWCYGDLGVAVSFLRSGLILRRPDLQQEAVNIMRNAALKRDLKTAKISDAGFCHGSIGAAHIFNRFYQYTGESLFKETALYWLRVALQQAHFIDGNAGYKKFIPEQGWFNSINLLEGIAGIGLVLMSLAEPIEPKWDEFFLLSHQDSAGNTVIFPAAS